MNKFTFLLAFCSAVYFMKEMLRRYVSPDLIADVARRREQRLRRKAARR